MDLIRAEAARWGVPVLHSEVVGLIPLDALLDAAEAFLQLRPFDRNQVLERRLLQIE
jgi:glutamate formiminotransferase